MSDAVTLKAEKREALGSAAVGRLRRSGKIPGVVYGADQDTYAVQVDEKTISDLLRHSASEQILVNLQIEGAKEANKLTLIQAIQHRSMTGALLHIDFNAVKEDQEIHARVPIELTGDAIGIKHGGILDNLLHELEIHCLPKDLPDQLSFDVSGLDIGDSLSIGEVEFPKGVTPELEDSVLIAIVNESRAAVSETEVTEEEGAAEPEQIGAKEDDKGDTDED